MPKFDVEYVTSIYITARDIEADSLDEAIEKADEQWHGKYPVVALPSENAPWLSAGDIHVAKDWDVNYDGMDDEPDESGEDR